MIFCPGPIPRRRNSGPWPENTAYGVSEGTIYAWKAKFGGMSVSDAQRLRSLEEENGLLKRLLADAMLDKAALNELLAKKW